MGSSCESSAADEPMMRAPVMQSSWLFGSADDNTEASRPKSDTDAADLERFGRVGASAHDIELACAREHARNSAEGGPICAKAARTKIREAGREWSSCAGARGAIASLATENGEHQRSGPADSVNVEGKLQQQQQQQQLQQKGSQLLGPDENRSCREILAQSISNSGEPCATTRERGLPCGPLKGVGVARELDDFELATGDGGPASRRSIRNHSREWRHKRTVKSTSLKDRRRVSAPERQNTPPRGRSSESEHKKRAESQSVSRSRLSAPAGENEADVDSTLISRNELASSLQALVARETSDKYFSVDQNLNKLKATKRSARDRSRRSLTKTSSYATARTNSHSCSSHSTTLFHHCRSTFGTTTDEYLTCNPSPVSNITSSTYKTAPGLDHLSSEDEAGEQLSETHLKTPTNEPDDAMVSLVNFERVTTPVPAQAAAEMESVEMSTADSEAENPQAAGTSAIQEEDSAARLKRQQKSRSFQVETSAPTTTAGQNERLLDSPELLMDDMDEEQLKRILACKRLSEGCNRFNGANFMCRKNSLHFGEGLPPVTEGEPMRHMSHHLSQTLESTSSSSASSASLRSATGRHTSAGHMSKRNSQDENTTSCSSSISLDGPRSPGRRRSSTVSQCSSVLSEGTRQQLNFDLSPDLPPDSSIMDANAVSPTDFDRPASPEPEFSVGSGDNSFDMRPISRMSSQYCDDLMLGASPDSTLGHSNENSNPGNVAALEQRQQAHLISERHETTIRENLERIISNVSAVRVSSATDAPGHQQEHCQEESAPLSIGQKRAHTPFGANLQRNKTSHISLTPSPTSQQLPAADK